VYTDRVVTTRGKHTHTSPTGPPSWAQQIDDKTYLDNSDRSRQASV